MSRDSQQWLIAFLDSRSLEAPDGRPLHAYRTTSAEFDELGEIVRQSATSTGARDLSLVTARALCLFAAEWWRRNHEGGPWKWEGILSDSGLEEESFQHLYPSFEAGLKWWKRELLRDNRGRIFLVTLACEGGLPLRLVRREGASLHVFFRHLLEEFHIFCHTGIPAEDLAEGLQRHLPKSLRHAVVFELGGRLVTSIWDLQERVGDASDPISFLDSRHPEWRTSLPLEIEDETAQSLLQGLVFEARSLKRRQPARFRANRKLLNAADSWELVTDFQCPSSLTGEQIEDLFRMASSEVPSRFQLRIEAGSGDQQVLANATELLSSSGRTFRVEQAATSRARLRGQAAAESLELWLDSRDRSFGPATFSGSSGLSGLPWVFVDGDDSYLNFAGQGSVRVKEPQCYVALRDPKNTALEGVATNEPWGHVSWFDRDLVCVDDGLTVESEDYICSIRTKEEGATKYDFRLDGREPAMLSSPLEAFLGFPRVLATPQEGLARPEPVEIGRIRWRPSHDKSPWSTDLGSCLGEVMVQVIDSSEVLYQTHCLILPANSEVNLEPGHSSREGTILLSGTGGALVGTTSPEDLEIGIESAADECRIALKTGAEPPHQVDVVLDWGERRRASFRVPFPARGARFIGPGGEVLGIDESVPIDALTGVHAVGMTVDSGERFFVEANLVADDLDSSSDLRIWADLRRTSDTRNDLELRFLKARLLALFAETSELDALIRLRIESDGAAFRPRPIYVQRFGAKFKIDRERGTLSLKGGSLNRKLAGEIRCEALRLWDPGAEPEILPETMEEGEWSFDPKSREPGPWLVVGWLGNECRIRPTLWTVGSEGATIGGPTPASVPILNAVNCADPKERQHLFRAAMNHLEEQPLCDDWQILDSFIDLTSSLPPSTLEVSTYLAKHPRVAVQSLILSNSPERFSSVWAAMEELPFLWSLIPIEDWVGATNSYATALLEELGSLENGIVLVLQTLSSFFDLAPATPERNFLKPVIALLRARELNDADARDELAIQRSEIGRRKLRERIETERQGLFHRNEDRRWLRVSALDEWLRAKAQVGPPEIGEALEGTRSVAGFRSSTLLAPVVVATSSVYSIPLPKVLQQQIRALRFFDLEWFSQALRLYFSLLIGRRFPD